MSEQSAPPTREVGRPTVVTPGVVQKLQAAFQRGFSVSTACKIARISRETYYKTLKESKEFADTMEGAQEYAKILAGDVILDVLQDVHRGKKDPKTGEVVPKKYSETTVVNTSRWFLEKLEKESFGSQSITATKVESDGKGGVTTTIIHATDNQFTQLVSSDSARSAIEEVDPRQLLEVLEDSSTGESVAGGEDQGRPTPVHTEELQSEHPEEQSLSQS